MAQGRPRDLCKEQEWQRWIDRWQTSGLSVQAFCTRHGLGQVSFYAWRRRLRQRSGPRFLPVSVRFDAGPVTEAALELVLTGQRRLRIPSGFDAATLRRLLAVLEETAPC